MREEGDDGPDEASCGAHDRRHWETAVPPAFFAHGAATLDALPIQSVCSIPSAAMRGQLRKSETVLSSSFLLEDILHGQHWLEF
jgi:hypothetical protein